MRKLFAALVAASLLSACVTTPGREWNDRNLYDALKRAGYEDYQGER